MTTVGLELEMVVACTSDGASHCVDGFFPRLWDLKTRSGQHASLDQSYDGWELAVRSPAVCTSLDNAFNNIETSVGPVLDVPGGGLAGLEAVVSDEFETVLEALSAEDATILNFSEHPAMGIDEQVYLRVRAPKPIYDYWVRHRGWDHKVGIDAKAQNSPTTGVPAARAIEALNTILAASPAFIALFANSPFENGCLTGLKETRLTIWPRMFATARFRGDRTLQRPPAAPFRNLRDYFYWMHGAGTAMQIVPSGETRDCDYKCSPDAVRVEGDPPLLDFLAGPSRSAVHLLTGKAIDVSPSLRHLEFQQFGQFSDARIRWAFKETPAVEEFLAAWHEPSGLEDLMGQAMAYCYIEGRSPGANFADADLLDRAGCTVGQSVAIAPSALQAGLLRNPAASSLLSMLDWRMLGDLREAAIRRGLDGRVDDVSVFDLCVAVVELAAEGLAAHEQWMLAYPLHVLRHRETGADRAISLYSTLAGSPRQRLRSLCERRRTVRPSQFRGQNA